jgi:hypothetical protein
MVRGALSKRAMDWRKGWSSTLIPRSSVLALVCVTLAGCGQAEYDRLAQERLRILRQGSDFLAHLHDQATTIVDQVASLRLPKLFDETSTSLPQPGQNVDPSRLQPPFVTLPEFRFCYEKFVEGEPREFVPLYCYFAVVDVEKTSASALLADLQKQIRAKFPRATSWQDVELDTPTGGKIAWKKIGVTGPQLFDCTPQNGERGDLDGRFELYVHSSPKHHILVGWRAPQVALAQNPLFDVAPLALGTLEVNEPGGGNEGSEP